MHIQAVLGDVDPYDDSGHRYPSLHNRASHAAHATVRARWSGGQRPLLTHGLGDPRDNRSSIRHRCRDPNGTGVFEVTRDGHRFEDRAMAAHERGQRLEESDGPP